MLTFYILLCICDFIKTNSCINLWVEKKINYLRPGIHENVVLLCQTYLTILVKIAAAIRIARQNIKMSVEIVHEFAGNQALICIM